MPIFPGISAVTWQTKLILLLVLFFAGVACGYKLCSTFDDAEDKKEAEATTAAVVEVRKQDAALQGVADDSATRIEQSVIPQGTITVEKEVIRYVTDKTANPVKCNLDADWVRIYNGSLLPEGPQPAGKIDGKASTAAVTGTR